MGPKVETLNAFVNGMGQYIGNFIPTALKINSYSDNSWFGSWRLFYWAWFIAWASVRWSICSTLSLKDGLFENLYLV